MISIRPATAEDLTLLLDLWRDLEDAQGRFRLFPPAAQASERIERSFRDAVASADADVLLAFDGAEAVGMALVHVERPSRMSDELAVELSRVVVRPGARGTGVGRALVDGSAAWARVRGVASLVAAVFVANEASRGFWRAAGFEPWVERMVRRVDLV